MGTDFYPRLVTVIHDPVEANRLVNEQAHVSLLLTGVGVLATIAWAPVVVSIFYSLDALHGERRGSEAGGVARGSELTAGEPRTEPLHGLTRISIMLYIAISRYRIQHSYLHHGCRRRP